MKKKKVKVPGITGRMIFHTKLRGYLDATKGTVKFTEEGWQGYYLGVKTAALRAHIHGVYADLEDRMAPLYLEGARLLTEWGQMQVVSSPRPENEKSPSSAAQVRRERRQAAAKGTQQERLREIEKRLSEIEEEIIHGLSQAAGIQREAIAQTNRRVQAYLYGASRAVHEVTAEEPAVGIPEEFQEEAEFQARHADHDAARRAVLQIVFEKRGNAE